MATLDDLLAVGDLPLLDKTTHRLPADTEATLPAALNKGVANGVAALNSSGVPVTAAGVPMAVIGTTAGTAADAAVVAGQVGTAVAAANAAAASAAKAPIMHFAVNGSYPGRPVTTSTQAVFWGSPDVTPPAFGTVTSGTGPVDGLDLVLLSAGAQVIT